MTEWHLVRISANRRAAADLAYLELDVSGTPLVGSHEKPGQYVRVLWEGVGEGFFAIASAPDPAGSRFEFLVKRNSPLSEALEDAPVGTVVKVAAPEGKGFPIDVARGRDVLLFATGSGISPIHSVIEVLRRERSEYGDISLYFGVRTPDAFAYEEDLAHWRADGIRVVQTVSQPGSSGWQGLSGYVQGHIDEFDVHRAVAYLCGQPEMIAGVTSALRSRGMPEERMFLNV